MRRKRMVSPQRRKRRRRPRWQRRRKPSSDRRWSGVSGRSARGHSQTHRDRCARLGAAASAARTSGRAGKWLICSSMTQMIVARCRRQPSAVSLTTACRDPGLHSIVGVALSRPTAQDSLRELVCRLSRLMVLGHLPCLCQVWSVRAACTVASKDK